jgi:hypothetical protein
MPIDLTLLCSRLKPENTVLFFGAGSSIPSGGSTAQQLSDILAKDLKHEDLVGLPLSETSGILVRNFGGRKELIASLRKAIKPLRPTRGLLNLPLFDWREIYTTNYDTLIEQSYEKANRDFQQISTNFDLTGDSIANNIHIYKLHGTIEKDVSDGDVSRIIITESDIDAVEEYREAIYSRFKDQINRSDLLIVGHSLADPDLRGAINSALRLKAKGSSGRIYVLLFQEEPNRAALLEDRNIVVCFGGIDALFSQLSGNLPDRAVIAKAGDPLDAAPRLKPSVTDVSHATHSQRADVLGLFHGRAATYADITMGITFTRDLAAQIESQLSSSGKHISLTLGVAGVGKTTLSRQVLVGLVSRGFTCWEHDDNALLIAEEWVKVAKNLASENRCGVLFIDDCHEHLRGLNSLVDALAGQNLTSLRLLLASSPNAWNPRVKTPNLFIASTTYRLRQLTAGEIDSLLALVDSQPSIRKLIENQFSGFSHAARRQRLLERCGSDMFVCLKNIFSNDDLDIIILKEYADLAEGNRQIYRLVCAMEAAGVRVHRQFAIRTLGIDANYIEAILANLDDLILERSVSEREGIYEWTGRHIVISETLSKYEFSDQDEIYSLLEKVVGNINPTYEIEIRTIRELCSGRYGIRRLQSKQRQNHLFRRLISIAPGQRVPRHRLITNLIDMQELPQAENEIRIYERELRPDAVVARYGIEIALRRVEAVGSILPEHRAIMAREAAQLAEQAIGKYENDKNLYEVYMRAGYLVLRMSGKPDVIDKAIDLSKRAEVKIVDPQLQRSIGRFQTLAANYLGGQ